MALHTTPCGLTVHMGTGAFQTIHNEIQAHRAGIEVLGYETGGGIFGPPIRSPTARFAAGVMSGQAQHEALIYCEDGFALSLIGASLPPELRRRCRVAPIGSKSELGSQALFHQRGGFGQLFALVWDGDVTDNELHDHVRKAGQRGVAVDGLSWARLPGGLPPEKWVLSLLDADEGRRRLAEELHSTEAQAAQIINELQALGDPHSVVQELADKAHLRPEEAEHSLIAAARKLDADPLSGVRQMVVDVLAGQVVQDPPLPA